MEINEFLGLDELTLRDLLEKSAKLHERRQIRAALRELFASAVCDKTTSTYRPEAATRPVSTRSQTFQYSTHFNLCQSHTSSGPDLKHQLSRHRHPNENCNIFGGGGCEVVCGWSARDVTSCRGDQCHGYSDIPPNPTAVITTSKAFSCKSGQSCYTLGSHAATDQTILIDNCNSARDSHRVPSHDTPVLDQETNLSDMAATARRLSSSSELHSDKMSTRLSPVSVGGYRARQRNSRTMLSEGGTLTSPTSRWPTSPSPTSQLLHIAEDINKSALTTKVQTSADKNAMSTADTRPNISHITRDANNSTLTTAADRHSRWRRFASSGESSHLKPSSTTTTTSSYLSSSPSTSLSSPPSSSSVWDKQVASAPTNGHNSDKDKTGIKPSTSSPPSIFVHVTESSSSQDSLSSLHGSQTHTAFNRRGSYSGASTLHPETDMSFNVPEKSANGVKNSRSETMSSVDFKKKTFLSPTTQSGRTSMTKDNPPTVQSVTVPEVHKQGRQLQRETKITALTSPEKGQVSSDSVKSPALVVSTTGLRGQRVSDSHEEKSLVTDKDGKTDEADKKLEPVVEKRADGLSLPSQTPETRTRSKFLSQLYSSGEKIKQFINRGKQDEDGNNNLVPDLGVQSTETQHVTSGSPRGHDSSGEKGAGGGKTEMTQGQEEQNERDDDVFSSQVVRENHLSPTYSPLSVADVNLNSFTAGRISNERSGGAAAHSSQRGGSSSLIASSLSVYDSQYVNTSDIPSTPPTVRHETPASVYTLSETSGPDIHVTTAPSDTNTTRFPQRPHHLSTSADSDVFLPIAPENKSLQALQTLRRHSFYGVVGHSASPASPSASPSSVSRPLTPTTASSKFVHTEGRFPGDRHRQSLPDITAISQLQLQEALKTAWDIRAKYASGLVGPLEPHPAVVRRSSTHRFLSDDISPASSARPSSPGKVTSSADVRKSRDIGMRAQLGASPAVFSSLGQADSRAVTPTTRLELSSTSATMDYLTFTPQRSPKDRIGQDLSSARARSPSPGASPTGRVVVGQDGKSYSYIDSCMSETELTEMLNSSEDMMERRRIRARMRELKQKQKSIGGSKGVTRLFDTASTGRPPAGFTSTATVSARDSSGSIENGGGSAGSVQTDGAVRDDDSAYRGVTSLLELQKLLPETNDPVERHRTRDVIRQQRQTSDSEQLKVRKPGQSRSGDLTDARAPSLTSATSPTNSEIKAFHDLPSPSSLLTSRDSTTSPSSDSNRLDNQPITADIVIRRPSVASTSLTDLHNKFQTTANDNNNGFLLKPALSSGTGSDVSQLDNRRRTSLDFANNNKTANVHQSDHKTQAQENTQSRDTDDVSNVLEQVKARLKSRSQSSTSDSTSPSYLKSSSKDNRSPVTPDSAFSSESGTTFQFPGRSSGNRWSSSEKSPTRSSQRSTDRGSGRYREVRQQILGSADLSTDTQGKVSTGSELRPETKATDAPGRPSSTIPGNQAGSQACGSQSADDINSSVSRGNRDPGGRRLSQSNFLKTYHKKRRESLTGDDKQDSSVQTSDQGRDSGDRSPIIRRTSATLDALIHGVSDKPKDKRYSWTLVKDSGQRKTSNDVKSFPTKREDELTDFEKLERGEKPSNSKTLVTSLAAKFTDSDNETVRSAPVRRSRSLHSTVRNALPKEKKHVTFVVTGISKERTEITEKVQPASVSSGSSSETDRYQPQILHPGQFVRKSSCPPETSSGQVSAGQRLADRTSDITPVVKEVQAGVEVLTLPPKSTVKRTRPVGRSLTESNGTRPEKYRSNIPVFHLARPGEKVTSGIDSNTESKQRRVGIVSHAFVTGDSSTDIQNREVDGHRDQVRDIGRERSDGANTVPSPQTRLTVTVDNRNRSKSSEDLSKSPKFKRSSVPVFGNLSKPRQLTSVTANSSLPQRRHSNNYSRRPASSMEQAFNLLLEDLDKVSSSEGNPSDLDLSDGEDLLASSGGSGGSHPGLEAPDTSDIPESTGTDNGDAPDHISETIVAVTSTDSVIQKKDTLIFSEPAMDFSSNTEDEVDSRTPKDDKEPFGSATTWDNGSTEVNDAELVSVVESGTQEDELTRQKPFSSSSQSSSSSATTTFAAPSSQTTIEDRQKGDLRQRRVGGVTGDQTDSTTTSSTMDYSITDNSGVVNITAVDNNNKSNYNNNNNNHDNDVDVDVSPTTYTSTKLILSPQSPPTTSPFAGTRTFNVCTDEDGGVTMQAVAEDQNQNRIVTVRTKKQRTPSDADEELRDTIVEKKLFSPSGAVLEERDVIQTKKRLTSRGSNYYTRSAYTTRTRRNREGAETVEHDVCVENENRSVSQGQAWKDKATTRVTLNDTDNTLTSSPSPAAIGDGTQEDTQKVPGSNENARTGSGLLGVTGRMDMSKASSGYGSVSGSEEDDTRKDDGTPSNAEKPEAGPPEVVQALKDVTMTEGKQIVLECGLMSAQTPTVVWLKDDVELTEEDLYSCRYDADTGKAALTITDATIFDTALYCCICQNDAGEARTLCRVVVKRRPENPPLFEKGLTDVTVTEGHSTILSCMVREADSVAWYKDGIVQRHSPDFKQTFDGHEARLEIGEVFLDDVGDYACVAKNEAGEQRSSCRLNVNACGSETTVVPMFLTKLPNRVVNDGEGLFLECDVIGSPEPNIKWLRDGVELGQGLSFSTCYDGRVASLQVAVLRIENAGCYTCVAQNPAGKVSMDANVTVQVKNKAPHFISTLENVSTTGGRSVILRCEMTGTPQPSVLWRKNGMLVGESHNFIQSYHNGVARLEILGAAAADSGHYECVAKNCVSEISCSSHVEVADPKASRPAETQGPRDEQVTAELPKITRRRTFKKLSEPRPADIISAVLHRASSQGLQRAQSFSPNSASFRDDNSRLAPTREDHPVATIVHQADLTQAVAQPAAQRPETLRFIRTSTDSSSSRASYSGSGRDSNSVSPRDSNSAPVSARSDNSVVSSTGSVTLSETQTSRSTALGRSVSMRVVRNNSLLSPTGRSPSPSGIKPVWTPPSQEQTGKGERTTSPGSTADMSELRPSSPIPGYRSVSPMFLSSGDREKMTPSPLARDHETTGDSSMDAIVSGRVSHADKTQEFVLSSPSSSVSSTSTTSKPNDVSNIPASPSSSSVSSSSSFTLHERDEGRSPQQQQKPQDRPPSGAQTPRVSALRLQFLQNDQSAAATEQKKPSASRGGGVRRWQSLPPQESKPNVIKRERSALATPTAPAMSSYETITDEEELHKLMTATENFDERKKIRNRLREVRDKSRAEWEAKRKQREAEAEDFVKKKFERAEEEKKKKMEAYKQQAPTHERDSKYHTVSQSLIQDKYKTAEEEKAKKLAAFDKIAADKAASSTTITKTTEKTPGGGTRTVTTKTTSTVAQPGGGIAYGKAAEVVAQELTDRLVGSSGPGVRGHITVKTESWNSVDGQTQRSQTSQSWGAKPQGAKGAMAAFKQMDNTNNPNAGAAKPNGLIAVSLAKRAATTMRKNAVAIKQELLAFCKHNTAEYEGVEVTNFSSSWNNGMAFCALIHHFYPNAFDFGQLDPKNRRYNFTLAFDTAEKEADIAPLLDVDDMVKMKNPDWKCVFTYVQSIYRHLKDHENNKVTAEQ